MNLYVEKALKDGRKIVYVRFAEHEPLLKESENIKVYNLDARI